MPYYTGKAAFVQNDERDVAYAPADVYAAHTPLEIRTGLWGVCRTSLAANQTGQFRTVGIFACKKASAATTHAFGVALKYNGTAFVANTSGTWIVTKASVAGDTHVLCRINGVPAGTNLPSLADADAANGTLYFSTTSTKLAYKTAAGVVTTFAPDV